MYIDLSCMQLQKFSLPALALKSVSSGFVLLHACFFFFLDESFNKEFLEAHNSYRALHKAPPLTYNAELNKAAQKWADECLASMTLGHSDTEDGENVFCKQSTAVLKLTGALSFSITALFTNSNFKVMHHVYIYRK